MAIFLFNLYWKILTMMTLGGNNVMNFVKTVNFNLILYQT